ncbi:MAG: PaaI family thioesterase [Thermodesulfovibrionia bacterium]
MLNSYMLLRDDDYCLVCGKKNPIGLRLNFSFDGRRVEAGFIPKKEHQGYMDIVHGGIISTLLDEAMVKVAIESGMPAVTAEMNIRLKRALNIGERVTVSAEITRITRKLLESYAIVRRDDGVIIADAKGKLFRVSVVK